MLEYFRCRECDLRFSCSVDDGGGPIYCPECRGFVTEIRGSRRPHYRRQKHGMPTWLIVVLVILGIKIGGGILIGGIVLLADFAESNQNWVTFQPPGGELQVDMPSTPKKEKSTADDVMPGNLDLYLCERRRGRECFGVGVANDIDNSVAPRELLNRMAQGYVDSDASNLEVSRKMIWNGRHPGCEVLIKSDVGETISRVHLVNDRAYMLVAIGPSFTPQSPDVVRFLNSFKVTNAPDFQSPATDAPPSPAK